MLIIWILCTKVDIDEEAFLHDHQFSAFLVKNLSRFLALLITLFSL